ncbi:hypothetical protein [Butyrivibrio hungatei]|uniref:hypothetical protein n=1 Tax=Butyrivibrio hungatei TaxID=185008 RepID=UPI0004821604|nr:hypothetical protein [Butyrivibrio hungatei]
MKKRNLGFTRNFMKLMCATLAASLLLSVNVHAEEENVSEDIAAIEDGIDTLDDKVDALNDKCQDEELSEDISGVSDFIAYLSEQISTLTMKYTNELLTAERNRHSIINSLNKSVYANNNISENTSYSDIVSKIKNIKYQGTLDVTLDGNDKFTLESGYYEGGTIDVSAIVEAVREEAYNAGKADGYKEGKEEGLKEGITEGIKSGRDEGVKAGKEEGFNAGKEEGIKEGFESGKEEGFNAGKEEGLTEGKEEGFKAGKEEGYNEGLKDGKADGDKAGYSRGLADGQKQGVEAGKQQAINENRQAWIDQGYSYGIQQGKTQGVDMKYIGTIPLGNMSDGQRNTWIAQSNYNILAIWVHGHGWQQVQMSTSAGNTIYANVDYYGGGSAALFTNVPAGAVITFSGSGKEKNNINADIYAAYK